MSARTGRRGDAGTPTGTAPEPAVPHAPAPVARRHRAAVLTVTYLLFAVMLSGALPTPLYPLYTAKLGLTPLVVAVVFAAYAVGILAALMFLGGLSDQIGRRATLGPAMVVAVVSCAVFAAFPTLPGLLCGRFLSGVAVGMTTGAATAYLRELHPRPAVAALLSTVVNMLGLGSGPLLSGVLAQYAPAPLVTPYLVLAVLLLPGLALFALPETARRRAGRIAVQRLGVPAPARPVFTAVAVSVFAAFSVLGLLAALTGTFLSQGLHNDSRLLVGVVVFAAFGSASLTQLVTVRLSAAAGTIVGMAAVPVGMALLVAALPAASPPLFLAGAVLSAGGSGAAFRSGMALLTARTPAERTGEVVSSYLVAAYLGLTLPVIGVGLLVSTTSLLVAASVFAVVVSLLAAVGIVATRTISRISNDR